jgi:putative acetyltransferase
MSLIIRPETAVDATAVYDVEFAAFGRPAEADLIRKLQQNNVELISLVACLDEQVVGHILFSPVTVKNEEGEFTAVALAPLAVTPSQQQKGIGSQLCRAGLAACLQATHGMVFVLGHSNYYPRFGFATSAPLGLRCQFDVPEEAFMVAELVPGALHNKRGVVYYHPLFSQV